MGPWLRHVRRLCAELGFKPQLAVSRPPCHLLAPSGPAAPADGGWGGRGGYYGGYNGFGGRYGWGGPSFGMALAGY